MSQSKSSKSRKQPTSRSAIPAEAAPGANESRPKSHDSTTTDAQIQVDQVEFTAYEVGVRLLQAILIAEDTIRVGWTPPHRLLAETVMQFSASCSSLLSRTKFPETTVRLVSDRLSYLGKVFECSLSDSDSTSYSAFQSCSQNLGMIEKTLLAALDSKSGPSLRLKKWFILGLNLVAITGEVLSESDFRNDFGPVRMAKYRESVASHPHVRELLNELHLRIDELMPHSCEEGSQGATMQRPQYSFMWGWSSIEEGMERLRSRAHVPAAAQTTEEAVSAKGDGNESLTDTRGNDQRRRDNSDRPIVMTDLHKKVIQALAGRACRVEELAAEVGVEPRKLHKEGSKRTGVLNDLKRLKRIQCDPRIGYYRPDALPPEVQRPLE